MSHKRSAIECEKGKETWTKNLVQFQNSHKRRKVSSEMSPLFERSRLPLQIHIAGRYLFLGNNVKSRKDRAKVICNEVIQLWDKFNFPHVSNQVVQSKIEKVLKTYDECVRRGKYSILDELFDITKLDGQWLCSEDKKSYDLQKENRGEVGYVTEKLAGKETIHPSKRIRKTSSTCVASNSSAMESIDVLDSDAIKSETEPSDHEDDCESSARKPMRRHSKTAIATNLVISSKLSTHKAVKVCKQLSNEGINIPTPSQSAAKMDFYYMDMSSACRSVMLTAKAVGVSLNKKHLDLLKKEQMTPEFIAINPQHCVPTLVDGDLKLWESRAICTYLVSQYGKDDSLYPKDPKTRAKIDKLLYFDIGTLYKRYGDYVYPVIFGDDKPDSAKLELFHESLGWFEGFLEGHDFCVGNSITVTDFVLIASVSTFIEGGTDVSKYPNIAAWVERCKTQMSGYETENVPGTKKFGDMAKPKLLG